MCRDRGLDDLVLLPPHSVVDAPLELHQRRSDPLRALFNPDLPSADAEAAPAHGLDKSPIALAAEPWSPELAERTTSARRAASARMARPPDREAIQAALNDHDQQVCPSESMPCVRACLRALVSVCGLRLCVFVCVCV
jgi:HEAT repeat protein